MSNSSGTLDECAHPYARRSTQGIWYCPDCPRKWSEEESADIDTHQLLNKLEERQLSMIGRYATMRTPHHPEWWEPIKEEVTEILQDDTPEHIKVTDVLNLIEEYRLLYLDC